eukprot:6487824-Amphidinium_carterae.1
MKFCDFFAHKGKEFPSAGAPEALTRALQQLPFPTAFTAAGAAAAATAELQASQESPGSSSVQSVQRPVAHIIPQHLLSRFNEAAPQETSVPAPAVVVAPPPPLDEMAVPDRLPDQM